MGEHTCLPCPSFSPLLAPGSELRHDARQKCSSIDAERSVSLSGSRGRPSHVPVLRRAVVTSRPTYFSSNACSCACYLKAAVTSRCRTTCPEHTTKPHDTILLSDATSCDPLLGTFVALLGCGTHSQSCLVACQNPFLWSPLN